MELPYDPAIPLLGIYLDKNIAALFIIAKAWKQPKCPSTDDWVKKIWCVCVCVCVCIMEYYSAIKKNKIMSFVATWMDLEIIILSEASQTEKDK